MSESRALFLSRPLFPLTTLRTRPVWMTLIVAILLGTVYNIPLLRYLLFLLPQERGLQNGLFVAAFSVFLIAAFNLILSLVTVRWIQKPVLALLLLGAASAAYFIQGYNVLLDAGMMQNLFETDPREAGEYLNLNFILFMLLFGVLPAVLLLRTRLERGPFGRELRLRLLVIVLSLAAGGGALMGYYQDFASLFRNHREVRYLITPSNYISGTYKYLRGNTMVAKNVAPLGTDARLNAAAGKRGKPTLLVLVVGETARSGNFSLNGYGRDTNPELAARGVVSFTNAYSCGTATALSVPCMFSRMNREQYDADKASSQENLMDVLKHAGVNILWRDNNSGCKGVCNRVPNELPAQFSDPGLCKDGECHDEAMLGGLERYLEKTGGTTIIVLHQLGSHGPAYYKRYPASFEQFRPVCRSSELQTCRPEDIVNAYDNSIRYTDHFLARVIDLLKSQQDRFNGGMLYLSDHGESLGENGVYLHGMPYWLAPDNQKHIPFITWLSPGLQHETGVSQDCLQARRGEAVSQDNLFDSVLGLLDVDTSVYRSSQDFYLACRKR